MLDIPQYLINWWLNYCPEPRSDVENIESGLRDVVDPGNFPISSSNTSPCQYWVKGLPAPCVHWDGLNMKCNYTINPDINKDTPSGYGNGSCDGLGRRHWCSKYIAIEGYSLDDYTCVLPCIEKSGSGKQDASITDYISIRPWTPYEIKGFNPDSNYVGQCDGLGMGRGAAGKNKFTIESMKQLPVICKHYKPYMMGFGAIVPRPFHSIPETPKQYVWKDGVTNIPTETFKIYDGSPADPLQLVDKRLPYSFKVYNLRARFQKCAYWDSDYGDDFYIDENGSDPSQFTIMLDADSESRCTCQNSACNRYKKLHSGVEGVVPPLISNIWAEGNTVVCNGAKPECPCYTGKWVYCIDENMTDGMRITANQIMELRFWTANWSSQYEYDRYFEEKPGRTINNFSDETTSAIYTFNRWKKLDQNDVNESIMIGKKLSMCMPAPINSKVFIPENYVNITEIEYPKARQYGGTHGTSDVSFPTLVRELHDGSEILPDINVIYPYANLTPWDLTPCNENSGDDVDYCIHNNNVMSRDPYTSIIGNSIRNKKIIVINLTYIDKEISSFKATRFMSEYYKLQLMTENQRLLFYKYVDELITFCNISNNKGYKECTSDSNGFFDVNDLALKNNRINEIVILCEFGITDYYSMYTYSIRKIKCNYFGALIRQKTFNQEYDSNYGQNTLNNLYTPKATIDGIVDVTGGHVQSVHSVYSQNKKDIYSDTNFYSYCVNEYEVVEEDVIQWTQIGATNYIWVELGNTEISYLFDFEIVEAYFTLNIGDDTDEAIYNLCDYESDSLSDVKINLKQYEIDNDKRKSIPPDAIILESNKPMAFFNDDWILYIKYKYTKLETFRGEKVVFPDLSITSSNIIVKSPFDVIHNYEEKEFSVSNIELGTVAVMAKITDDEGRIQACAATKMLLYGHRLSCRNVDIFYAYTAEAQAYGLDPYYGYPTWIGPPKPLDEKRTHYRNPLCGDHECSSRECIGPMWFPYNNCNTFDFYNVLTPAAFCTQLITEADENIKKMGTGGWRWGVADEYNAWVKTSGTWLESCGASFYYFYSKAGAMRFSGKAYKKTKVDEFNYSYRAWDLPPFGNLGREIVERWLFKDYHSFIDMSKSTPLSSREYVPIVLDKEDLFQDLDCFTGPCSDIDNFKHFPILSTMVGLFNNELDITLDVDNRERYRFNDVINIIYNDNCSYPLPVVISPENKQEVTVRYGFKNDNLCWIWPEYHKSMIRGMNDYTLNFLDLNYPEYLFDYVKQEHRLTLEEGYYSINFTAPKFAEKEELDSESDKYPSISINGNNPRFFKIIYDEYDNTLVDWQDESISGEQSSSGGTNIYEVANNGKDLNGVYQGDPKWLHDFNTLFGVESSTEITDNRKVNLGVNDQNNFEYGYYNIGLVANIYKNLLHKLPIYETIIENPLIFIDANNTVRYHYDMSSSIYTVPSKIIIKGYWGFCNNIEGVADTVPCSKPGIEIAERYFDESNSINFLFPSNTIVNTSPVSANSIKFESEDIMEEFEIELELPKIPNRFSRPALYFQVKLTSQSSYNIHEYLNISSLKMYVGKYVDKVENIFVYEKKYICSTQSVSSAINSDGIDSDKYRIKDLSYKNAGQYFPADSDVLEDDNFLMSKTTIVNVSKYYEKDEEIKVTYDSIKDVEKTAQEELYNLAYDLDDKDEINFKSILPPYVSDFFDMTFINKSFVSSANCKLVNKKVPWQYEARKLELNQSGDFFQPGGHYFEWSDEIFRTQCRYGGPIESVYEANWVHHKHGGTQPTMWTGYVWTGWLKYGETDDGNFIGYLPSVLENMNTIGAEYDPMDIRDLSVVAKNL